MDETKRTAGTVLKEQLKMATGQGTFQPDGKVWDDQYKAGEWDYLHNLSELAHYSVNIGYFKFFKAGGTLLDIGCGEGIIPRFLGEDSYSEYLGIDISKTAVQRAEKTLGSEKTRFIASDCSDVTLDKQYDVIMFCESLNCMANPEKVVPYYEQYLKDDGLFIISLFRHFWVDGLIWKKFEPRYELIDTTEVKNSKGQKWKTKILRKKGALK